MKRGLLLALLATLLMGQATPQRGATFGTQLVATFNGADTASASAVLGPGSSGQTTYICGFSIAGLGATSATNVTVTIGALAQNQTVRYPYNFPAGATVVATPLIVQLSMCVAANAQDTAITVTVPGAAGNTSTQINAHGYAL